MEQPVLFVGAFMWYNKTDEAGTLDFSGVPAFLLLKKMLTAAGYDYEEVQKMVNSLLE